MNDMRKEEDKNGNEVESLLAQNEPTCSCALIRSLFKVLTIGRNEVFALQRYGFHPVQPHLSKVTMNVISKMIMFASVASSGSMFQNRMTWFDKKLLPILVLHVFSFRGRSLFRIIWMSCS